MTYLIDGHNLIPKIAGMSLQQLDDETRLLEMLQVTARVKRLRLEVYFDKAPAGRTGTRKVGTITVHAIPEGIPADDAIIQRFRKAKQGAKNLVIVTSDHRIQREASAMHAKVVASETFAQIVQDAIYQASISGDGKVSTDAEIEEWMRLFNLPPTEKREDS